MSERKVLTKYFPPDFDPSKITRTPKHLRPTGPKLMTVRLMAPFSMKCTSCGEYIYKGRKFNARKETSDEKYLNLPIYRFYIRCTRCSAEITFKTDPKNMDYTCEKGAKRNFEVWRNPSSSELQETDDERLDRLQREQDEEAEMEQRNAMEELEQKTNKAKKEMEVADALDEIRMRNARIERGERGPKEDVAISSVRDEVEEARLKAEREDEEAVMRAFERGNAERVRQDELEEITHGARRRAKQQADDEESMPPPPPPSFEKAKKAQKVSVPGLVRKTESVKVVSTKPASLGLGGYDSDSE